MCLRRLAHACWLTRRCRGEGIADLAADEISVTTIAASVMLRAMSNTEIISERDVKTGRFLPGNSGFGGRPKGSRNKLGEQFLLDLHHAWSEHGPTALSRCAGERPAEFCRIIASLLPQHVDINATVGVNAASVLETFRMAVTALGNTEPKRLPKVIDADRS